MPSLNLKHLRYFWAVAANGTMARAAEILHVTPQTISGQLLCRFTSSISCWLTVQ
jgi:LysR family transcriptional activator of nhaA